MTERQPLKKPETLTTCYGCGVDNKRGLGLTYWKEGDAVVSDFTPSRDHGGYGNVVHGGVIATAIDETLGWAIYGLRDKLGVTTDLRIKYELPVFCEKTYVVRGHIAREDERDAVIVVEIHNAEKKRVASGEGNMRFVSPRAIERIGGFKW
ncbi:MAG: PaaI family thioesterase [Planctomycetota bacterium]